MEKNDLCVGGIYKVYLPGESPWAKCLSIHDDGSWDGEILNDLMGSADLKKRIEFSERFFGMGHDPIEKIHNYKKGDILRFYWKNFFDDVYGWSI